MRKIGDRWWEAVGLAAVGSAIVVKSWPGTTFMVRLLAIILLSPLLTHGIALIARLFRLPPSWKTWSEEWGLLAFWIAVLSGLEQHSVSWGLVVLSGALAFYAALFAAAGVVRRRWNLAGFPSDRLSSLAGIVGLGIVFGYIIGLPESTELNEGITFAWRRALWGMGLTWVALWAAMLWKRQARPSA